MYASLTCLLLGLVLFLVREVVRLRRANTRLFRESRTDALTGCWNARHWKRRTARLQERAQAFAFVLFDLANLKAANSLLGHAGADVVLAEVAAAIRRETDMLFRIGGDEFAVLLIGGDLRAAKTVRDRIEATVGVRMLAPTVPVFLAGGVAAWHEGTAFVRRLKVADLESEERKLARKLELGVPTTREATLESVRAGADAGARSLSSTAFRLA